MKDVWNNEDVLAAKLEPEKYRGERKVDLHAPKDNFDTGVKNSIERNYMADVRKSFGFDMICWNAVRMTSIRVL